MDIKELQTELQTVFSELKGLLQDQKEQLETHAEVLEQLIQQQQ